jgi:hypothetical protein
VSEKPLRFFEEGKITFGCASSSPSTPLIKLIQQHTKHSQQTQKVVEEYCHCCCYCTPVYLVV